MSGDKTAEEQVARGSVVTVEMEEPTTTKDTKMMRFIVRLKKISRNGFKTFKNLFKFDFNISTVLVVLLTVFMLKNDEKVPDCNHWHNHVTHHFKMPATVKKLTQCETVIMRAQAVRFKAEEVSNEILPKLGFESHPGYDLYPGLIADEGFPSPPDIDSNWSAFEVVDLVYKNTTNILEFVTEAAESYEGFDYSLVYVVDEIRNLIALVFFTSEAITGQVVQKFDADVTPKSPVNPSEFDFRTYQMMRNLMSYMTFVQNVYDKINKNEIVSA